MTREEAMTAALNVAGSENTNRSGPYFEAGLELGTLEPVTVNDAEFWEATLVDDSGATKLCLRIWGGLRAHTNIRPCEAAPAPPPRPRVRLS